MKRTLICGGGRIVVKSVSIDKRSDHSILISLDNELPVTQPKRIKCGVYSVGKFDVESVFDGCVWTLKKRA